MFVCSTYRITGVTLRLWMCLFNTAYVLGYKFHHAYVDTTLTAAYVCVLPTESLGYTTLMAVSP